jgi:hypothetical protein
MAKTVFFPGNRWGRAWVVSGHSLCLIQLLCLSLPLWLALAVAVPSVSFALGTPTDLQAVEPSPDDVSAAARYFDEGRSAFKQERYVEAAEAFEKADALAPNAKVLLLAIQSRELGGHLSRAATLAALATQRHPKDELFADVGQLLKSARSEFNFLVVTCDDPCQVMIGNRLLHGAPATRRFLFLEQGKYRIRASWGNGKSLSKYFEAEVAKKGSLRFDSSDDANAVAGETNDGDSSRHGSQAASDEETNASSREDTSADDSEGSDGQASSGEGVDEDYWADGEAEEDPPDDPLAAAKGSEEGDASEASEASDSSSDGWSPVVFWVGASATVVLAGASTWSGVHTLNNPGREAVVRDCVGLGVSCPTYQEGLRNQDRTNILWTVTASVGVISGLIGLLLTDWDGDEAKASDSVSASGGHDLTLQLQPLVSVGSGQTPQTRGGFSLTGSYLTATGRF